MFRQNNADRQNYSQNDAQNDEPDKKRQKYGLHSNFKLSSNSVLDSDTSWRDDRQQRFKFMTARLDFTAEYLHSNLSTQQKDHAIREAKEIFCDLNALMSHLVDIRIISLRSDTIRNVVTNVVSVRVRPDFATMLYYEEFQDLLATDAMQLKEPNLLFAFMISTQLEPIVTIVAVHTNCGKLINLHASHFSRLQTAIQNFKQKFGLQDELYAYTPYVERQTKSWHSKHWHLKMRIPTDMLLRYFPSSSILIKNRTTLDNIKKCLEPINYNFELQPMTHWKEIENDVFNDLQR
jgi:hypothetical protein